MRSVSPSVDSTVNSTGHPAAVRGEHSWAPVAPCSDRCLPPPESLPRVSELRVAARMAGFMAMLAAAAVLLGLLSVAPNRRNASPTWLFRMLLRPIGVRVVRRGPDTVRADTADGADGAGGVLVVSNHLSWLDVLALSALEPMRMVAKQEIRDYPLIGAIASRNGTLFVDRAELRTLPDLVDRTADVLRGGGLVGLFPEGTTWCGAASGVFRRAGFQAALDAGVPVRPVAQRLLLPDGSPTTVGAFIGEDTVLDSLMRVVRLPGLQVEVQVLPLLETGPDTDRRTLARAAELAIAEATGVPAPELRRPAHPVPLAA